MASKKNVKRMSLTTGSGKDVKDTMQLKGLASKTKAESATNETVTYKTGSTDMGKLGGNDSDM